MDYAKTLLTILEDIGFAAKERKGLDSQIAGTNGIELISPTENAVIIEGVKM